MKKTRKKKEKLIRKEGIFYLRTHSTHFYFRLNGVGHMLKDH